MQSQLLPANWQLADLGDISSDISYGYTASATSEPTGVKLLRITDIQNNTVNWSNVPNCKIEPEKVGKYRLKPSDLVFARTGATVGKSYLLKGEIPESVYASYLIRVRCLEGVSIEFLANYFQSPYYWRQITDFSAGIGQPNVNGTKLKNLSVPVPPLAEQKVIADKLDTLLAQVENTKARLERIPQILKRFRQSVLAAAVSGRLTEEWRHKFRPPQVNLQEITENLFKEGLTAGNFGRKSDRAPQLTAEELELVVKHVEDWPLIRVGELCACIVPNRDKPKSFSGGYHWLLTPHFQEQSIHINYQDVELGLNEEEVIRYKARVISKSDVVMTCIGRLGLSAIVEEPSVINQQLHAFKVNDYILPEYLSYCIRANKRFYEARSTSTTINYLNKSACNSLPITVPTIEEQTEITRRVDQLFTHANRIEQQVNKALARVNNLTQSILAKAFRGELTEQWREDNPALISGENSAEALLERIKAERAAMKPAKKTRQKRTA